jgi:hypothetical protein
VRARDCKWERTICQTIYRPFRSWRQPAKQMGLYEINLDYVGRLDPLERVRIQRKALAVERTWFDVSYKDECSDE